MVWQRLFAVKGPLNSLIVPSVAAPQNQTWQGAVSLEVDDSVSILTNNSFGVLADKVGNHELDDGLIAICPYLKVLLQTRV